MTRLTGDLDAPLARLVPLVEALAVTRGLTPEPEGDGLSLLLDSGRLRLAGTASGTELELSAIDPARLEELQAGADRLAGIQGLTIRWHRRVPEAAPRLTVARVMSCARISPSFRRVRLAGDFARFASGGLHFRLLFGPKGAPLPAITGTGLDWPAGIDAWHRPPYTVRALDPAGAWLDVDIFLHEGGRVTEWTENVREGDVVALTGPGGSGLVSAPWVGFVGDETALPVILRMVEALPEEARGVAAICVADPRDAQPVRHPPGLRLDWVTPERGLTPLQVLQAIAVPEGDRFVFFAGERRQAAAARDWLARAGLERGEFRAAAYWTEGWVPPPPVVWPPE